MFFMFLKHMLSFMSIKYYLLFVGGQLIPYVQIALERAGPNIQSEDKRVSEDDQ